MMILFSLSILLLLSNAQATSQEKKHSRKKQKSNLFRFRNDVPECVKKEVIPDTTTSKMICLDGIQPGSCIVYSFGINYQWDFDDFMSSYGCTVYSFDPGMNYKSKRGEHHFFEKVGLGAFTGNHTGSRTSTLYNKNIQEYKVETVEHIMERLGHKEIDILRMDTEGAEYEVLAKLPFASIKQISLEIHMWKHSYNDWVEKLSAIPMVHLQTYQNTDRVNKETMHEIAPGVTRVYEMTFVKH